MGKLETLLTHDGILSKKLAIPNLNTATRQSLEAQLDKVKAKIHRQIYPPQPPDPLMLLCARKAKRKEVWKWMREAERNGDDERMIRLERWIEDLDEQIEALEDEIFNAELDAVFGPG